MSELYDSVTAGNLDSVNKLLGNNADVNAKGGEKNRTPLMVATEKNNLDIARALLKVEGCDVNLGDNDNHTALHLALKSSHIEMMQLLLDAGADMEHANDWGLTALNYAAYLNQPEALKVLLEKGANVKTSARGVKSCSPLHLVVNHGQLEMMQILLDHGADLRALDEGGRTAMHSAAYQGRPEPVKLLIKCGLDVNTANTFGDTPLGIAVRDNHPPVAHILLEAGATITSKVRQYLAAAGPETQHVVQEAVKAAERDAQPQIFISYQWGVQDKVKTLKQQLETHTGLSCWMDIGEMAGGDQLYEEIDSGIRGAKVIVSCATEKYAASKNCRREISLADDLSKPIIPLLIEKMKWPPEGPMGFLLTGSLYIRFYKREGEAGEHSWPEESFQQLLGQISSITAKD